MTAEFAIALPAVVLVLTFCLAVLGGGVAQLRAGDAARAGARAAAIGAEVTEVRAVAGQLAGPGADVQVECGELVRVTVSIPLPGLGTWGDVSARAQAVAVPEP